MSRIDPPDSVRRSISDGQFIEQALTILALRLKHEVALTRALRGEGRHEGFLGLFLSEEDAQAMLDELAGRIRIEEGADVLARVARAERELRRKRAAMPDLAWARVGRVFELADLELELLLYAAAPSFDPRYGRVYGFLNDDMARRALTPALAQRLLRWADLDLASLRLCLSPGGPLQRHGLIRVAETTPRSEASIIVPEEVIDLLLGIESPDPPLAERFDAIGEGDAEAGITVLVGRDCGGAALVAAGERPLLSLQAGRVAHLDLVSLRETLLSFLRHGHLVGALPYLTGFDSAPVATRAEIARLATAPCVLDAVRTGVWADAGVSGEERLAEKLSPATEATLLGGDGSLARVRGVPFLERLRLATQHEARTQLAGGLRARAARFMESVAQPVESNFGFDDLVLSPGALARLRDFVSWRRHAPHVLDRWGFGSVFNRRPGSVALFRGPPGTGKTVAASVVANAMGLPLFRVDLAGTVSKYIGETEKNLERVFAAAAASEVVLFFDEADALFGKRSEVSDAHDRYANIETSYLLQRIESQDGAVILATNLEDNMDTAFLRRIDVVVDFPAPGPADRLRLWQRLGATGAPVAEDLDLSFLAENFELTGGEIRNVLIAAAHAAARDGGPIGMGEIVRALAQELQKLGRPLRRLPFGPHYRHLSEQPA